MKDGGVNYNLQTEHGSIKQVSAGLTEQRSSYLYVYFTDTNGIEVFLTTRSAV